MSWGKLKLLLLNVVPAKSLNCICAELLTVPVGRNAVTWADDDTVSVGRNAVTCALLLTTSGGSDAESSPPKLVMAVTEMVPVWIADPGNLVCSVILYQVKGTTINREVTKGLWVFNMKMYVPVSFVSSAIKS